MTPRAVLSVIAILLAAHGTALALGGLPADVSGLLLLVCSISASLACYWRSTRTTGPVRRKWDFLASALALWSLGEALQVLRHFAPRVARIDVLGPDFYYLVYGIPILLAVSTSNEERDTVLFTLIDSIQAMLAVGLVYIEISSLQPALAAVPVHEPNFALLYGAGSWLLFSAACLRVMAGPRGEERSLYRNLVLYLFCFAILATPWRGTCVFYALPLGAYRSLLGDAVFLLLTAGCLLVRPTPEPDQPLVEMNPFALVLNNGSPILFTLAVLALGALVARRSFGLGIASIAVSLMIYCFRAALLQSAYMRAQHALTRSQQALREANTRLRQLSMHDALTGLPNRRQFDQTLELEWNRALRNRRLLSLLIVDIDCFKALNDLYGHPAGDECLLRIAGALQGSLRRAGEIAARYGGEEFAAILPDVDNARAAEVGETMREAVLSLQILHEGSTAERFVTASIGVATVQPAIGSSPGSLISAADDALYRAKRGGRNQVALAAALHEPEPSAATR